MESPNGFQYFLVLAVIRPRRGADDRFAIPRRGSLMGFVLGHLDLKRVEEPPCAPLGKGRRKKNAATLECEML